MHLFRSRHSEARDATFPLRREERFYTTDLRFLARSRRLQQVVEVFEFTGIDHLERQRWILVGRARSWDEAAALVGVERRRDPRSAVPATPPVLAMPELLADAGG